MKLNKNLTIGYGLTGSFCSIEKSLEIMEKIAQKCNIIPIMSYNTYNLDTKFGKALDIRKKVEKICNNKIINTIQDAEPLGPKELIDLLVIVPCSSNTISKLALDINDTPITMACKSALRKSTPIVIGISTNNALSGNAENIGKLLNRKNYFFVPFKQDNPITKPRSIVCDFTYIEKTIEEALEHKQISPIIL